MRARRPQPFDCRSARRLVSGKTLVAWTPQARTRCQGTSAPEPTSTRSCLKPAVAKVRIRRGRHIGGLHHQVQNEFYGEQFCLGTLARAGHRLTRHNTLERGAIPRSKPRSLPKIPRSVISRLEPGKNESAEVAAHFGPPGEDVALCARPKVRKPAYPRLHAAAGIAPKLLDGDDCPALLFSNPAAQSGTTGGWAGDSERPEESGLAA